MFSLKERQRQENIAEADPRDLVSRSDKRKARVTVEEALKELAISLVALKPKNLKQIELPDYVVQSIEKAKSFKSPKARNRQVLVIRQHLRELDADAVQFAVTDILFPPVRKGPSLMPTIAVVPPATAVESVADAATPDTATAPDSVTPDKSVTLDLEGAAPPMDRAARIDDWERRLVQEGDGALALLLAEYPHADRQGLRQLLRAVRRPLLRAVAAGPEASPSVVTAAHKRSTFKLRTSLRSLVR